MSHEDEEKEIEATKAPLMDHLIELRSRLIKAATAFIIAMIVLLLLRQADLQHSHLALRLGRRPGEFEIHLYGPARIFRRAAQDRGVRRHLHRVSGDRHADLHVRRARPLSQREAGVPAVPDRHADLLPDGIDGGLFRGLADAGAVFAQHAADRRAGAGDHRAVAQGRGLSVADDEADAAPSASPSSCR